MLQDSTIKKFIEKEIEFHIVEYDDKKKPKDIGKICMPLSGDLIFD